MSDFQDAKAVVRAYQAAVDSAAPDAVATALAAHTSTDYLWRGMHPFDIRMGAAEVAEVFWSPLKTALTSLTRREDIFMAGRNQMDDFASVWVVSMGHLMGLFDEPWLGIPATGKIAMLRYCEFSRVVNGKICETAMYDQIAEALSNAEISPDSSELAYLPNNLVQVTDEDAARKILKLVDNLEELEDVKAVHGNYDIDGALLESLTT